MGRKQMFSVFVPEMTADEGVQGQLLMMDHVYTRPMSTTWAAKGGECSEVCNPCGMQECQQCFIVIRPKMEQ